MNEQKLIELRTERNRLIYVLKNINIYIGMLILIVPFALKIRLGEHTTYVLDSPLITGGFYDGEFSFRWMITDWGLFSFSPEYMSFSFYLFFQRIIAYFIIVYVVINFFRFKKQLLVNYILLIIILIMSLYAYIFPHVNISPLVFNYDSIIPISPIFVGVAFVYNIIITIKKSKDNSKLQIKTE